MPQPFLDISFPNAVARGAPGGPVFSTNVVTLGSGSERRNIQWANARGEWNISTGIRTRAEMQAVIAHRVFQRMDPWKLGDSRCQIDLGAPVYNGSGMVASVISNFDFTASGIGSFASGVFSRGKIGWATGDNAGLAIEVKAHSQATPNARLSLFLPMPRLTRPATHSRSPPDATSGSKPAAIGFPTWSISVAFRTCRAMTLRCPCQAGRQQQRRLAEQWLAASPSLPRRALGSAPPTRTSPHSRALAAIV